MTNKLKAKPILGQSEQQLMDEVLKLSDAGGSVIQIRTREVPRTLVTLRKGLLMDSQNRYYEWDQVNGSRTFTLENADNHQVQGDGNLDFATKLFTPLAQLRDASSPINAEKNALHYFVFSNPQAYISDNPYAIELLQQLAAVLPVTNACVILVTSETSLSGLSLGTVLITDAPTPSAEELEDCLRAVIDSALSETQGRHNLTDEDFQQVAQLGLGMTRFEFETYASIAIVEASTRQEEELVVDDFIEGIGKGKTEVVKQSDILELFHTEEMENVGGMRRLKDWINDRAGCFDEEAIEFGIEPPKGIGIVGVPGSGKSLIAKALASALRVPLIRLDFSAVFSKFVGDSESRMRSALKMVEGMDRLVLFADEIDKGLGGIGQGGGDSGTSSRVLGYFLTWMQETKSKAFVVVTANRIEGLPPELFRKGRLDEIFSVGLPNREERREVLEVHLRKRGRDLGDYSEDEIQQFLVESEGFVPAEIEASVKTALIAAYNDKTAKDLEIRHIIKALKDTIPLSRSHKEQIDRIVAWAADNATPVNYPEQTGANMPVGTRRQRSWPTKVRAAAGEE